MSLDPRRILAPVGLALLLGGLASAAPVYKYVDEDGNVTYSEVPPPREDVETVRVQPNLPPGREESAQERLQRMQDVSSELEEARQGREGARAERGARQPTAQPQTVWPDDRASDRYPYRYFPQRPPASPGRPPVGIRPPVAVPPIELPEGPGGGAGLTVDRPIALPAR